MKELRLVFRASLVCSVTYVCVIWLFGLTDTPLIWWPQSSGKEPVLLVDFTGYWDVPAAVLLFTAAMWLCQPGMRNRIAQFVKSDGVGLGLLYGVLTIVALPFMLLSFANGYLAVTAVAGAYLLLTGCLVVLGTLLVVLGYTLRPIVCWIWR